MATREWNNLSPADNDNINQGAAKIRETRLDIDERLQVDHINAVSMSTDGYHKKVTLSNQGSRPTTLSNYSILWAEDSGGVSQPYMKDGDGNIRQLGVPVGAIVAYLPGYFTAAANVGYTGVSMTLPDGWVLCDGSAPNDSDSPIWNSAIRYVPDLDDSRFLCGDTAGNRGIAAGSNTLTAHTATYPNHTHAIGNHTITVDNAEAMAHTIGQPAFKFPAHAHGWGYNPVGSNGFWTYTSTGAGTLLTTEAGTHISFAVTSSYSLKNTSGGRYFYTSILPETNCTRSSDVTITNHAAHNHTGSVSAHSVTSSGGGSVTISNNHSSNDNKPQYLNVSYIIKIK